MAKSIDIGRSGVNWYDLFGERVPALVDGLRPGRLVLLAGIERSTDRRNSHAHPEVCFVLKGSIVVQTTVGPLPVRSGSALLVAPHMYHRTASQSREALMLWMSATPNHMGCSMASVDGNGRIESLGEADFLEFEPGNRILTQIIDEASRKERGWLRLCRAQLNMLFVRALRQLGETGRPLPPQKDYSAAQIITFNARAYIQRNYAEPLTLGDVAHHVALSPNYLAALFKKQFGTTVIHFLTEVRIEEAKRLLVETDMKTSRIAEEVGYHSPYYFSRAFKKAARCSPSIYRQTHRRTAKS